MTELGKQVWKKMEEMGWENAPEDFHLEYYENIIECTKQALTIHSVGSTLDLGKLQKKIDEILDSATKEELQEYINKKG